jgi:hypothetical protein
MSKNSRQKRTEDLLLKEPECHTAKSCPKHDTVYNNIVLGLTALRAITTGDTVFAWNSVVQTRIFSSLLFGRLRFMT